MTTLSIAFIFEGSQRVITIDGEGDVFNNAVFNLLTTLAENADYGTHNREQDQDEYHHLWREREILRINALLSNKRTKLLMLNY